MMFVLPIRYTMNGYIFIMDILQILLQIIVALGIFNVWILRYNKSTSYRGGNAKNMKDEFAVYGLPTWSINVIGFLKIIVASTLIIGIWIPFMVTPAAILIAGLMIGATSMHLKIHDRFIKTAPALIMLLLSAILAIITM